MSTHEMSLGRCECGRPLSAALVQFHQKLGSVLVLVCDTSLKLPQDCDAETVVRLKRIREMEDETYDVYVWGKRLGAVGTLLGDRGWIWVSISAESGIVKDRESAVKTLLGRSKE